MKDPSLYQFLADAVLALHVAVVLFVVGGLIVIVLDGLRGGPIARSMAFRLAHLAAIAFIVTQAWLGAVCPLTILENRLRAMAHGPTYAGSFIEHWLQRLIFYEGPSWAFTLAYTLFGAAVVAAWWFFPPRRRRGA